MKPRNYYTIVPILLLMVLLLNSGCVALKAPQSAVNRHLVGTNTNAKQHGVWSTTLRRDVGSMMEHRRRRRLAAFDTAEIYGPFRDLAYYYADVYLGTPPQRATVIVDTGSTLMALPCKGCVHCGEHMDKPFDLDASNTSERVDCKQKQVFCARCHSNQCGYATHYAEGSGLSGWYVRDVTWVGSDITDTAQLLQHEASLGIPFVFGCHERENGLFVSQQADGIMGVGPSDKTLISQLHSAGKLEKHMFAMCLTPMGGVLSIGDYNATHHLTELTFVPYLGSNFYKVHVHSVGVQGFDVITSSSLNSGSGIIVDSGTSMSYLPHSVLQHVIRDIDSFCSNNNACRGSRVTEAGESVCYRLNNADDLSSFPTISLELDNGLTVTLPPEAVFLSMIWFQGGPSVYCLGFYSNGGSGGVIGANAMFYHDVVFDRTNKRVGFARSQCPDAAAHGGLGGPGGIGSAHFPHSSTTHDGPDTTMELIGAGAAVVCVIGLVAVVVMSRHGSCNCSIFPRASNSTFVQIDEHDMDVELASQHVPARAIDHDDALRSDGDEDGSDSDGDVISHAQQSAGLPVDTIDGIATSRFQSYRDHSDGDGVGNVAASNVDASADAFEIGSDDSRHGSLSPHGSVVSDGDDGDGSVTSQGGDAGIINIGGDDDSDDVTSHTQDDVSAHALLADTS